MDAFTIELADAWHAAQRADALAGQALARASHRHLHNQESAPTAGQLQELEGDCETAHALLVKVLGEMDRQVHEREP